MALGDTGYAVAPTAGRGGAGHGRGRRARRPAGGPAGRGRGRVRPPRGAAPSVGGSRAAGGEAERPPVHARGPSQTARARGRAAPVCAAVPRPRGQEAAERGGRAPVAWASGAALVPAPRPADDADHREHHRHLDRDPDRGGQGRARSCRTGADFGGQAARTRPGRDLCGAGSARAATSCPRRVVPPVCPTPPGMASAKRRPSACPAWASSARGRCVSDPWP